MGRAQTLLAEAQSAAQLYHSHVVFVYDANEVEGVLGSLAASEPVASGTVAEVGLSG